ncbi:MAG TPA: hypothetical protein DE061_05925, partial [Clostridiales bacterium]|nr:hypothetical protein [Clostridiales bacterium]
AIDMPANLNCTFNASLASEKCTKQDSFTGNMSAMSNACAQINTTATAINLFCVLSFFLCTTKSDRKKLKKSSKKLSKSRYKVKKDIKRGITVNG